MPLLSSRLGSEDRGVGIVESQPTRGETVRLVSAV